MKDAMNKVDEFRAKYFKGRPQIGPPTATDSVLLQHAGTTLLSLAHLTHCLDIGSGQALRAHLMCEELGELMLAMGNDNEVGILDALADLCYVVIGTALDYGLPLAEAFHEVHKSNMTKTRTDDTDVRLRKKGDSYVPPDLQGVLDRCKQ